MMIVHNERNTESNIFGFYSAETNFVLFKFMGGSRISGKGVRMFKGMGIRFADFISFFFKNIP